MPEHQPQVDEIFDEALRRAAGPERAKYLEAACGDDPDLKRRVERLLRAVAEAGSFLESPAQDPSPTIDQAAAEKPGTRIGPYKLLQQIGEGGFGVVYMAEQIEPVRRKVALKIVKPGMDTKEVVARFEAERQALALMDHPNIAKVLDGGETESGRPFFVMELVKGVPLTEFCDANKLATQQRLELFATVCRAVQHAHQKGVIHRDLKPSNVMVTLHDGRPVPKIIDFGVSKAISQQLTEKTLFTRHGQMIGTPAYMSPEQAEMSGLDIDTRSDIYSLGVLLYELLTGVTPLGADKLRGAAFAEMQRIIREEEPPKPSTRLSTLGEATASIAACRGTEPKKLGALLRGDLDWIVMRALAKDRERRYESAISFANDVERYLNRETVEACPPSLAYKVRSFIRRNRRTLVVAGMIEASLLIGVVVSIALAVRLLNERDRANSAEALARHRLSAIQEEQENTRSALAAATRERNRAVDAERNETVRRLEAQREKEEAERQRRNAEHQARIANARRLAARSREALQQQPDLSLLLAVEALQTSWRHDEPHVPVAEQTLRDALATIGGTPLNRPGVETRVVTMTAGWIVTADDQATHLFDLSAADPAAAPLHLNGQRALSSRGEKWLVTVDRESTVRLRDLRSNDATATLMIPAHPGRLEKAMVSRDGHWLVTATEDGVARVWNLLTGEKQPEPLVINGHKPWQISSDSRWLATEGEPGRVHLWDLAADDPTAMPIELEVRGEVGELHSVVFGPQGRWLAACSRPPMDPSWDKNEARLWDLKSEEPAKQRMRLTGTYADRWGNDLFSPDGRWLLLAGSGESTLWDLHEDDPEVSPIQLQTPHLGGAAIFSPDSKHLVIANRTWNLAEERLAKRPRGSKDAGGVRVVVHTAAPALVQHEWSTCAAFDHKMRWVAHALPDKRIGVWDLMQISSDPSPLLQESFALRGHADSISSLDFSSDGRWLLSEGAEGNVRLWDFARKVPGVAPAVLRGEVAVSVSPDGRWLATTRSPRAANLWDLSAADPSLAPIRLTGHTSLLREAAFSPDSRWLVTVDRDLNMQIRDLASDDPGSGVILYRPKEEDVGRGVWRLFAMKFSADGRWLYAAPDKEGRLWDLSAERPAANPLVLSGYDRVPTVVDFSPNGRWLVAAGGKTARLWDLAADEPSGRPADLSFAAFDAGSRWLITFVHQASAPRLWDLAAENPASAATPLRGHDAAVNHGPILSPSRRWLATSAKDRTVQVWDLQDPKAMSEPLLLPNASETMSLAFSRDGRWLLGSDDILTRVWDLAAADPASTATVVEGSLHRISPDSRWFVAGNELWSLSADGPAPMPTALVQHGAPLRTAEFSPDGRWLTVYAEDEALLFDLSTTSPVGVPILLTGALRKHSEVFPRRGEELLPMPFSADGRWLVGCSYTGDQPDTLLINLHVRELVKLARRTAGRELTNQEKRFFLLNDSMD